MDCEVYIELNMKMQGYIEVKLHARRPGAGSMPSGTCESVLSSCKHEIKLVSNRRSEPAPTQNEVLVTELGKQTQP